MEKISIGIEKRVALPTLELAITSLLDGSASPTYFKELAMRECTGENRAKKVARLLNRLTISNTLAEYMKKNSEKIYNMLHNQLDRPLLFTAIMCSGYMLFYDTVSILGKYLHVQDTVGRKFLLQKLSEKYGSNRLLDVAFDCVMPMLIEAGVIKRDGPGLFSIVRQLKFSEYAQEIFQKSFLLNNPNIDPNDDFMSNPYFEYIRQ